jgi:hypothetical protein
MLTGTLTVTLRPLRIAFIVTPGDRLAISDAIRMNSYLWGGEYNPIVPFFRKIPTWLPQFSRPASATQFFKSYLELFDPDFVVRLGSAKDASLDLGNLKEVPADEIRKPVLESDTASYGIGLFEILEHLLHEEFRFTRNDLLRLRIPKVGDDLFLASVFGIFPDKVPNDLARDLNASRSFSSAPVDRDNYVEFLAPSNLFARRICHHSIRSHKRSWWWGDYVFLMDADDLNDILLYWNYRALGWRILPVPVQVVGNEFLRKHAADFIEANYWPMRRNPSLYNHTTILKSPKVTGTQLQEFAASLSLKPAPAGAPYKMSLCSWLPRFWDEWARSKDGADRAVVRAEEMRVPIRIENNNFQFQPLMPPFAREYSGHGTPRCANELELSVYGDNYQHAQVIPAGGSKLARAAHFSGINDLRCSNDGIVFFPKLTRWSQSMSVPSAEAIFSAWFEERGWRVSISDKGHVIKQLLRQMGGLWNLNWLTEEQVLRFLMDIPKLGPICDRDFRSRLNKVAKTGGQIPAERFAEWLVESNIVRLGLEVACPKCRQRSWYSVAEADYTLVCRQCLESYRLPAETLKAMPWAYRGAGAFGSKVEVLTANSATAVYEDVSRAERVEIVERTASQPQNAKVPDRLQGGLSVLLLVHMLASDMHPPLTPLLSFNASKDGQNLEVDLALFIRQMRSGIYQDDVVFAECKSFHGRFTQKNVRRMENFAQQFPGAVVIFATLRRELDAPEKRLLIPFVNRGRRRLSNARPNNPVIIFTGNELFSSYGPRHAWRDLGPPFSHHADEYGEDRVFVSLADATQQLYLGLPSIHARQSKQGRLTG